MGTKTQKRLGYRFTGDMKRRLTKMVGAMKDFNRYLRAVEQECFMSNLETEMESYDGTRAQHFLVDVDYLLDPLEKMAVEVKHSVQVLMDIDNREDLKPREEVSDDSEDDGVHLHGEHDENGEFVVRVTYGARNQDGTLRN